MSPKTALLTLPVAALLAACGDPSSDPAEERTPPAGVPEDKESAAYAADTGKADWSLDPCDWWGWYDDGDCDGFCMAPDPDCDPGPDEQRLADAAGLKSRYTLTGDTW